MFHNPKYVSFFIFEPPTHEAEMCQKLLDLAISGHWLDKNQELSYFSPGQETCWHLFPQHTSLITSFSIFFSFLK